VIRRDTIKGVLQTDNVFSSGEESLDDMTSLTSKEIDQIELSNNLSEECERDPSKENCEDFAYGADEAVRFANTAASYAATTQIEVKKLRNIENDKNKLIAFLKSKGYLDLVSKVEQGSVSTSDIVNEAAQRYETQREATFGELSKAFERKQLVGSEPARLEKVRTIKADLANKKEDFKQLMLFNNVVTSFLDVQKRDQSGEYVSAGTNVKALQRELTRDTTGALQGLSGLASGTSQLSNNDSPIVDQSFIQSVLGEQVTPQGQPAGLR